jgi:hypothetical protein
MKPSVERADIVKAAQESDVDDLLVQMQRGCQHPPCPFNPLQLDIGGASAGSGVLEELPHVAWTNAQMPATSSSSSCGSSRLSRMNALATFSLAAMPPRWSARCSMSRVVLADYIISMSGFDLR